MVQRGFTMVEMIIVLAVFAVIGTLLMGILVNNTGVFYTETSRVDQGVKANDALTNIRAAIRGAQGVAVQFPLVSPVYVTGENQLVLQYNSVDSAGSVIVNTFDYAVYFIDSGGILRHKRYPNALSKRSSADQVLAQNIDSLNFQYLDTIGEAVAPTTAAKIRFSLSFRQKAGTGYVNTAATEEASLRNNN